MVDKTELELHLLRFPVMEHFQFDRLQAKDVDFAVAGKFYLSRFIDVQFLDDLFLKLPAIVRITVPFFISSIAVSGIYGCKSIDVGRDAAQIELDVFDVEQVGV